jgi:hypothetical protein
MMKSIIVSVCLMVLVNLPLVFLVLLPAISQAQISEIETKGPDWQTYGQVKYVGPAKASLEYIPNEKDSTFMLLLWDMRPELKNYFSITFSSKDNTVEQLYQAMMSVFEKSAEKSRSGPAIRRFQLGNQSISLYKSPTIGATALILSTERGRIELTRREVKKLFGR